MAIAESHLSAIYNTPEIKIIDHFVFAIVTDGDMMEGITSEAASLAGHLKLGKVIYFYDDNRITIDGSTDLSFSEDCESRFIAYGWQVLRVEDGNDIDTMIKHNKGQGRFTSLANYLPNPYWLWGTKSTG